MALFVVVYGQCCGNKSTDRARDTAYVIINNGRMLSSLVLGYSQCQKPTDWRANPDEETTDWRARRGKTAHRVRREGTAKPFPTPIQHGAQPERGYNAALFIQFSGPRPVSSTLEASRGKTQRTQ
jgi:hypothetical protein